MGATRKSPHCARSGGRPPSRINNIPWPRQQGSVATTSRTQALSCPLTRGMSMPCVPWRASPLRTPRAVRREGMRLRNLNRVWRARSHMTGSFPTSSLFARLVESRRIRSRKVAYGRMRSAMRWAGSVRSRSGRGAGSHGIHGRAGGNRSSFPFSSRSRSESNPASPLVHDSMMDTVIGSDLKRVVGRLKRNGWHGS